MNSILKLRILFLLLTCSSCTDNENKPVQTVTDADGNIYNTITVGNQVWMLENLKTTSYNDGTPVNKYVFGDDWHNGASQIAYYQWADTFDLNNQFVEELPIDYYGAMYNHYAIQSGKLAPKGWRIPTVNDFTELENYLTANGYAGVEAQALKTTTGWLDSSGAGTDAISFKGLPNGYINGFGGPTLGGGICTWATGNLNTQNSSRTVINL